jgi:hypothetical protein
MTTARIANLRLGLRGFVAADTASPSEGRIELGRYWVLEERSVGNDVYARLEVSHFGGGDTWICTRSGGEIYADVLDAPTPEPRRDFAGDPKAIEEAALVRLFPAFDGFVYDRADGQYPWRDLAGIRLRADKKQNNCCTFVEALLVRAFEGTPGFSWSLERHNQMMIAVSGDDFAPVTAAVESGMAVAATSPDTPPAPWSIVQGWRNDGGGHTFLVVDHDPVSDRVLVLESNASSTFKLNGPGYRGFGPLETFKAQAPPAWNTKPECWTWARLCSFYPRRLHAAVRVKSRQLSGL